MNESHVDFLSKLRMQVKNAVLTGAVQKMQVWEFYHFGQKMCL